MKKQINTTVEIYAGGIYCESQCFFFSREAIAVAPAYCNLFNHVKLESGVRDVFTFYKRCDKCLSAFQV